jgi:hypothetical protein
MRAVCGGLIFLTGVVLGFAWTLRDDAEAPRREPGRRTSAILETVLEPTGLWDDGEPGNDAGSEDLGAAIDIGLTQRFRAALTLAGNPEEVAELIGGDLARGETATLRALFVALAELPWARAVGVYRAVLFDPLLRESVRIEVVEGIGGTGHGADHLLRDLLAREGTPTLRTAIHRALGTVAADDRPATPAPR